MPYGNRLQVEQNTLVLVGPRSDDLFVATKGLNLIFNPVSQDSCLFRAHNGFVSEKPVQLDRAAGYAFQLILTLVPNLTKTQAQELFESMAQVLSSGRKNFQLRQPSFYVAPNGYCAAADIVFPQP